MELVGKSSCAMRFPFGPFRVCKKICKQQHEKPCWKDLAALQLWENWNHGELLAVAYCGDVAFCLPGGTTVA